MVYEKYYALLHHDRDWVRSCPDRRYLTHAGFEAAKPDMQRYKADKYPFGKLYLKGSE